MPNFPISKEYSEVLRQIETTDPGHADTVNPLFQQLINNIAFLKDNVAISIKEFGAKGDGVSDDTQAIQDAIDYAFDNEKILFVPNPEVRYSISAPLKIYGFDPGGDGLDKGFGTIIIGESRNKTVFQANASINAMFQVVGRESTTANLNHIKIENIYLDCNDLANNGIEMTQSVSQSVFRELRIISPIHSGIYIDANNFLNLYEFIRLQKGQFGINYNSGTSTSNRWVNFYCGGQTDTAYKVKGIYCTLDTPCADNVTGTVFDLTQLHGTVLSPGSESDRAMCMFKAGQRTNVTIVNPYTWGNFDDAGAVHFDLYDTSAHITVVGGTVMFDRTETNRQAPGNLYSIEGFNAELQFVGIVYMGATQQSADRQYPAHITNQTRPKNNVGILQIGDCFFDQSLNQPIWFAGNTAWVDATGTVVYGTL